MLPGPPNPGPASGSVTSSGSVTVSLKAGSPWAMVTESTVQMSVPVAFNVTFFSCRAPGVSGPKVRLAGVAESTQGGGSMLVADSGIASIGFTGSSESTVRVPVSMLVPLGVYRTSRVRMSLVLSVSGSSGGFWRVNAALPVRGNIETWQGVAPTLTTTAVWSSGGELLGTEPKSTD